MTVSRLCWPRPRAQDGPAGASPSAACCALVPRPAQRESWSQWREARSGGEAEWDDCLHAVIEALLQNANPFCPEAGAGWPRHQHGDAHHKVAAMGRRVIVFNTFNSRTCISSALACSNARLAGTQPTTPSTCDLPLTEPVAVRGGLVVACMAMATHRALPAPAWPRQIGLHAARLPGRKQRPALQLRAAATVDSPRASPTAASPSSAPQHPASATAQRFYKVCAQPRPAPGAHRLHAAGSSHECTTPSTNPRMPRWHGQSTSRTSWRMRRWRGSTRRRSCP